MSRQERRAQRRQQAQPQHPAVPPSRGPQTYEGKAVSSQNATTHGLTAARLVLPWESKAEFDQICAELLAEHRPATITERILVRELAEQYWRLQRARNHEYKLLAETSRVPDPAEDRAILLAERYVTRFERAFHKCLSTLRTLQKERRRAEAEAAESAKESSASASEAKPKEFVSQNQPQASDHCFAYTVAPPASAAALLLK